MSTYKNISNGTLHIQGTLREKHGALGVGATKVVAKDDTFVGSNYYDRFTYAGMIAAGIPAERAAAEAILLKTVDDYLPFSSIATDVPNIPKVYHSSVTLGSSVDLDFLTDLGGPAMFMSIESTQAVSVYINKLSAARVDVAANGTLTFQKDELLVNSIRISNTASGNATATVQVVVGTIIQ